MAVSYGDVTEPQRSIPKQIDEYQVEYCSRMLRNVSQNYKQTKKIASVTGVATAFEKGPYSRCKKRRSRNQNEVITIS